jgi:hypothetical protein
MIVIDTQARITVGVEENSAKEMGLVVAEFDRLRRVGGGSTILIVHHQGNAGQQARGSSAMLGAAQTELTVTKKDRLVTVAVTKQKDDEPYPRSSCIWTASRSDRRACARPATRGSPRASRSRAAYCARPGGREGDRGGDPRA